MCYTKQQAGSSSGPGVNYWSKDVDPSSLRVQWKLLPNPMATALYQQPPQNIAEPPAQALTTAGQPRHSGSVLGRLVGAHCATPTIFTQCSRQLPLTAAEGVAEGIAELNLTEYTEPMVVRSVDRPSERVPTIFSLCDDLQEPDTAANMPATAANMPATAANMAAASLPSVDICDSWCDCKLASGAATSAATSAIEEQQVPVVDSFLTAAECCNFEQIWATAAKSHNNNTGRPLVQCSGSTLVPGTKRALELAIEQQQSQVSMQPEMGELEMSDENEYPIFGKRE
jgi:hypothetical protein